ncbi:MAG: hypothetical protein AAF351_02380 [Pseudomonadota bacterium]
MRQKIFVLLGFLILPTVSGAQALWGNDMAGDRKLPKTWGIGIDYFDMSQPYQIDGLTLVDTLDTPAGPVPFDVGAILAPDPSVLPIDNDITNFDIKVDVWLFPFLNVFGIYGQIDGETNVNLGVLGLPLPPATNSLTIDYDGEVFGGGLVLAFGGDQWFGSVTTTFTDTSLSGDFNSSVSTTTIQPRIGLRFEEHTEVWIGGYIIDAEEEHRGLVSLDLGLVGGMLPVDAQDMMFDVELSQDEDFNPSVGMHTLFNENWEATVEVGFDKRQTALANITYRF